MSTRCLVVRSLAIVLATAATTVLAQPAEKKPPRKIERKPAVPVGKPGASDPALMPKPAPELAQLKYFLGTWHCEGNAPASPMGPAHRSRATVVTRLDLGGFWYSGTVREEKAADNPHPLSGMFHETYDAARKQFVLLWFDNFGGWSTETSTGWDGNKIVYSGEAAMGGEKVPVRDTFTKKGDAELVHSYEMTMSGQKISGDETCRKVPAARK
jgi:hypothetical protein